VSGLLGKKRADFQDWAFGSVTWIALLSEILPRAGAGRTVRAEDDRTAVEMSEPLSDVTLSGPELSVEVTLAGAPLGVVTVAARQGRVRGRSLRRAIVHACGFELCRQAVREVILGRRFDTETPLGEQIRRRARDRSPGDALRLYSAAGEPVAVLARRTADGIGTSASRRSVLPSASLAVLRELSDATAEPILEHPASNGRAPRAVYAPEVAIAAGASAPAFRVPSVMEKTARVSARLAQRAVPELRRKLGSRAVCDRLPILMYHRIATTGPAALAPYRVSPERFEEQLRFLKEAGYYSVSLEEWREAVSGQRTLRGKPILLTFDDGYSDFATHAWPLLRRYGFGALVLLVSDLVGGTSDWDRPFGSVEPLMSWREILEIQEQGCDFGSHTVTHPPLTSLDSQGIVREVASARAALERRLGRRVKAIAYPYGDVDPIVSHLAGACGYLFGLTCVSTAALYSHSFLSLPRIEVSGADTLHRFVWKIEHRKWDSPV
jgi:peptidoglycan/xylan/chitin deacetylase (PgdA/CDA1 family)